MKIRRLSMLLVACALSASAIAADSKSASLAPMQSDRDLGLGIGGIGTSIANISVITGWIPLSSTVALQPYFGIPSTTGTFNILGGSALKFAVAGTQNAGFHLGGDVLLGSVANSFTAIFGGLLGVHFNVAPSIMIQADGGPQIAINNGNTDFSVGGFSGFLGASILYIF